MKNLIPRLINGSILAITICILISLATTLPFNFLVLAVILFSTSVALWEFYQMASHCHMRPLSSIGLGTHAAFITATFLNVYYSISLPFPQIALLFGGLAAFIYFFSYNERPFANLSATAFGILYITLPLSTFINILYFPKPDGTLDGRAWIFYLIFVVKITDTIAYFIGNAFGKRPLCPSLSPKKTIEGAIGGTVAAMLSSLLFALCLPSLSLHWAEALLLGGLISGIGQVGDLCESLLKRNASVKDSNRLAGLGGVLDIFDSLIFTCPFLYLYLLIKIGESI
jgi:phosphatidate cytidylyltransferase